MSGRDGWSWYRRTPKRPPPKRGIKAGKGGSTWWGRRWIGALDAFGYASRLARGRTYARAGRTHDLSVKAGLVTARVTGSRATPYKVRITLRTLSDAVWKEAIDAMAGEARFAAELLAGRMPLEIDRAFREAGESLFPVKSADLGTDCSCPDWANPCKHVAATHYVLGEAFDRDPFLLFELRGRTKEQVLEALRTARAGAGDPKGARRGRGGTRSGAGGVPSVSLAGLRASDYDKPRAPLPSLDLSFEAPPVSGALLRQLGAPAGWRHEAPPAGMLGPMIEAAAERARALAMADPDPGDPAEASGKAPADKGKSRKKARRETKPKPADTRTGTRRGRGTRPVP